MTEEEAKRWTGAQFPADVVERVDSFVGWLREENTHQNLVAPSTLDHVWSRHIVDSLQLIAHAGDLAPWLDIGTGGGFPGLVVGIATGRETILVEPRRRRAAFLESCARRLALPLVRVIQSRVEQVTIPAAVISARAVATIENILRSSMQCAKLDTRWILPRGTISPEELDNLIAGGRLVFHVEQSLTDTRSSILIVDQR